MSTSSTPTPEPRRDAPGEPPVGREVIGYGRSAPRLGRFVFAGVLLGVLVAAIALVLPGATDITDRNLFFLTLLTTGPAGAILGLIAFWLADRRSLRERDRRMAQDGVSARPVDEHDAAAESRK